MKKKREGWNWFSNKPAEVCPPYPFQYALHCHTWNSFLQDVGVGVSSMFQVCCPSFTDQFTIKAGESNSKGLKSTERVIIVQSEHIFCYTTKLHHDVVSWGEKTFRDEQFHSEAKGKNQTTTKKKSQTKPNHKNPTCLAAPNMCGWCIHPFPPEGPWNLSSRVTVLF